MPLNMQAFVEEVVVAIMGVQLLQSSWSRTPSRRLLMLLVKKQVVVFRDEEIEPQHEVAFSRRFGPTVMLFYEHGAGAGVLRWSLGSPMRSQGVDPLAPLRLAIPGIGPV